VGTADADHPRGVRPQRAGQPLTDPPIRLARAADVGRLREIEAAAGEAFRDAGMPEVADYPLPTDESLAPYVSGGRAWVATEDGVAVAYVVADEIDGCAHVAQVSVHPGWARRGIGRALLDRVDAWAAERGLPAVTLTTFADVPWNAPYYARLGFAVVDAPEPGLRAVREHEAAIGLDRWPRVAMRRRPAR
jgi:GNAT superfamily N-acetyltransferase